MKTYETKFNLAASVPGGLFLQVSLRVDRATFDSPATEELTPFAAEDIDGNCWFLDVPISSLL